MLPPVDPTKPVLRATKVGIGQVTLDGNTADWLWRDEVKASFPIAGTAPTNATGSVYLLWDDQALYVLAIVFDPTVNPPDPNRPSQLYNGDGLTLELGPERPADTASWARQADAYYMFGRRTPAAIGVMGATANGRSFEPPMWTTQVQAVIAPRADGYVLEARIPWANTRLNQFQLGTRLAANIVISDRVGNTRTGMVTTNSQRDRDLRAHPAYWHELQLVA